MTRFRTWLATIATISASTPSLAHPGSHHGMAPGELLNHLVSGWHLVLLVAAGLAGLGFAALARRRSARRASAKRPTGGKP